MILSLLNNISIQLDLDIRKCGYSIFKGSKYLTSGIIKTAKEYRYVEIKTKKQRLLIKDKEVYKAGIKVGEWRKVDSNKYTYFSLKEKPFEFANDVERAKYLANKLQIILNSLDLSEFNMLLINIEESDFAPSFNHRKSRYIGMVEAITYASLNYPFRDKNDNIITKEVYEVSYHSVSTIRANSRKAYLVLIKDRENIGNDNIAELLKDKKYISKEIIKMVLHKEVKDDEADAINLFNAIDKYWYAKQ